ncbi:hypothetical protein HDU90_009169 [Geranomyces variabilis]|nr:hypothetical protein HDU90_009169 [Geranomyces variabilis]
MAQHRPGPAPRLQFDPDQGALKTLPGVLRAAEATYTVYRELAADPSLATLAQEQDNNAVKICQLVLTAATDPNHAYRAMTHFPLLLELIQRHDPAWQVFQQLAPTVNSAYLSGYLVDILNFANDGSQNRPRTPTDLTVTDMLFLLTKLYGDYPQEVYMAIHTRLEPQPLMRDTFIGQTRTALTNVILPASRYRAYNTFFNAFVRLCEPKHLLAEFLDNAKRMIESNWPYQTRRRELLALWNRFDDLICEPSTLGMGSVHRQLAQKYGDDIRSAVGGRYAGALRTSNFGRASGALDELYDILLAIPDTPYLRQLPLSDYSTELASYNRNDVPVADRPTIPGTYPPVPVMRFDPNIHIFRSMRRPKKITVYVANDQAYHFMFKYCGKYNLQFAGHQPHVWAMSPFWGLVEFIESITLEDITKLTRRGEEQLKNGTERWTHYWLGLGGRTKAEWARRLYERPDTDLTTLFTHTRMTANPLLAWLRGQERNQNLPEAARPHVTENFTKEFAAMSMASVSWEHLQKFLVTPAAHVIAINYDLCLNRGVGLAVPEVVPMRWTRQIESAVDVDAAREIMTAMLTAFRRNPHPIIKSLELAAVVPPKDVAPQTHRLFRSNQETPMAAAAWRENPRRILLDGAHAKTILLANMQHYHETQPFYANAVAKIKGAFRPGECPAGATTTPTRVVETLFVLAKAPTLLARMWKGWSSWA